MKLLKLISGLAKQLKTSFELRKYDSFTIAEYFRKQGAKIGDGCSIIPKWLGPEPYLIKMGNHVTIATGVQFITHDGGSWLFRHEIPDIQVFGTIVIEDNCVIGQDAILFPNIRIGKNSIVGANSVVITDVPPDTIVMGVPARPFGSVAKYREKCVQRWHDQKPPDYIVDPGETWWNSKHFPENRERLKRHLLKLFEKELS